MEQLPVATSHAFPSDGVDPDISIIIACFNEEAHLARSMVELDAIMRSLRISYEYVFVDDASRDGTVSLIRALCDTYCNAQVLIHDQNMGRGASIMDGIQLSRGRYAGFLDIDLEVHPHYIISMLASLDRGADVAIAHRFYKLHPNPVFMLRHLLSVAYRWLACTTLNIPLIDTEAGYKFFNLHTMRDVLSRTTHAHWFWDTEVMALAHVYGKHIVQIPTLFIRNPDKKSTVKLVRDTVLYFQQLISFKRAMRDHAKPHLQPPSSL